jgi:hypothetical protein
MPTSNEVLPNKPLTGTELKEELRQDFERLLENEGLLQPYVAYGRIAYELKLTLHLDNQMSNHSESRITSRTPAKNAERRPPIEPFPLDNPSDSNILAATKLTRQVDSPNEERIRAGMPVPVDIRNSDHTVTSENVQYPKDYLKDELGEGKVKIEDEPEDMTRRGWNLLKKVQDVVLPPEDRDY